MAMTAKYAGTTDAVSITEEVETAITARFDSGESYNAAGDVEVYCCEDGILLEVPVMGGPTGRAGMCLNWSLNALSRTNEQYLVDLKAVYDGKTASADRRKKKAAELEA